MSVAVVQAVAGTEASDGGTPKNITISATGAGNMLVVCAYSGGDTAISSPTAPAGTWIQGNNFSQEPASSKNGRILWLPNISAGITTVTWTGVAGDNGVYVYELSGADITTPLDVQTSGTSGNGTTATDGALTATNPGSGMISFAWRPSGSAGFTVGAGFTNLLTGALTLSGSEVKANISGSNTGTFGIGEVSDWSILSVIFKPQVSGSSLPTGRARGMQQVPVFAGDNDGLWADLAIGNWF